MSIKIQDKTSTEDSLTIYGYSGDIEIQARDGGRFASGLVDRAEFFAAVAAECNVRIVPADAIVIERGELPEVTVDGNSSLLGTGRGLGNIPGEHRVSVSTSTATAAGVRREGLAYLALAEYLDANPPVDEAQVIALAHLLVAFDPIEELATTTIARRLYLAGVRVEAAK